MITLAHPQPILALFNNGIDEEAFSPLLEGLPGITSLVNPPGKENFFQKTAALYLHPSLVIISSRLYPQIRPELVADIKEIFPGDPAGYALIRSAALIGTACC